MATFGADYTPTTAERFRTGAFWALLIGFGIGATWTSRWLDAMRPQAMELPSLGSVSLFVVSWLLSRPKVKTWLERGRPVQSGKWRTARALRIDAGAWTLLVAGWGYRFVDQAVYAWRIGDTPRLLGACGVAAALTAFAAAAFARRGRSVLELSVDRTGVSAREWKGVVPWSAIDFVVRPDKADSSLRLVLRPEALATLPDYVRRRNGFLDLDLSPTVLSPITAVDALRAACPDLEVRHPRSAGLVLPVRGATDIVEADL